MGLKFPSRLTGGCTVRFWKLKRTSCCHRCLCIDLILCSGRCRNPSERPGHLRLLLEFWHHRGNRGRSLPEGEQQHEAPQMTRILRLFVFYSQRRCSLHWLFVLSLTLKLNKENQVNSNQTDGEGATSHQDTTKIFFFVNVFIFKLF